MWVARDKSGSVHLWFCKPIRIDERWISNDGDFCLEESSFPHIKWEDEPIEVELTTVVELLNKEKELKNVYHELLELQTKEIRDLNRVIRGVQLEEVSKIINDIEERIHSKYKMNGDISCSQNCRMVTIAHSSTQISDNSLREYIKNDKIVATIYIRRNDFNTADMLISDFGEEYYSNNLQE